jgi:hypothetical protein
MDGRAYGFRSPKDLPPQASGIDWTPAARFEFRRHFRPAKKAPNASPHPFDFRCAARKRRRAIGAVFR